ncbi:hypothetical protein AVEN_173425-1 [Araneus ventricosus]|uniref:Uncharacterized protein n=1 Tax=Araneus ventricosus TaxID=182803 RepID=A0A4Y2SLL4_ARAVE|nr:hypothetical protein AVEN_173425-1 [Araneus ventricosus]
MEDNIQRYSRNFFTRVKPRSYGLSFHEFRPRFALFHLAGIGRIDVARGLLSASVVSGVMAVNSSHVKGRGSGQTASVHPFTRTLPRDLPSHADHSPQVRTSSDSRFDKRHAVGTRLKESAKPAHFKS